MDEKKVTLRLLKIWRILILAAFVISYAKAAGRFLKAWIIPLVVGLIVGLIIGGCISDDCMRIRGLL